MTEAACSIDDEIEELSSLHIWQERLSSDPAKQDLYVLNKNLENEIAKTKLKIEIAKIELKQLTAQEISMNEKIRNYQNATPLRIGTFVQYFPEDEESIVECDNFEMLLYTLPSVDKELLTPGSQVMLHGIYEQGNFVPTCLVGVVPAQTNVDISVLDPDKRPDINYSDIGGLEMQKIELRELVELPLNEPDLMTKLGIDPPKGVLLYGPPGCGKTMLVKAVAKATSATFIHAVGSEFVKMFSGEGPRKVREVFKLAKEKAPSILFIDEIDSVAIKRSENVMSSGEKEIQRILMEFLVQLDGFEVRHDVVVIMATNRPEILDPAILRPGRLDRKIEVPYPSTRERRLILQNLMAKMQLAEDVDPDFIIQSKINLSGADCQAIVREAAILATREQEYIIRQKYLAQAFTKITEHYKDVRDNFYQ